MDAIQCKCHWEILGVFHGSQVEPAKAPSSFWKKRDIRGLHSYEETIEDMKLVCNLWQVTWVVKIFSDHSSYTHARTHFLLGHLRQSECVDWCLFCLPDLPLPSHWQWDILNSLADQQLMASFPFSFVQHLSLITHPSPRLCLPPCSTFLLPLAVWSLTSFCHAMLKDCWTAKTPNTKQKALETRCSSSTYAAIRLSKNILRLQETCSTQLDFLKASLTLWHGTFFWFYSEVCGNAHGHNKVLKHEMSCISK